MYEDYACEQDGYNGVRSTYIEEVRTQGLPVDRCRVFEELDGSVNACCESVACSPGK
jgi:hypothetical protein